MACVHIRELYQLCHQEGLRVSSSDLIHFVCPKCGVKEVCPSTMVDLTDSDEDTSDVDAESQ